MPGAVDLLQAGDTGDGLNAVPTLVGQGARRGVILEPVNHQLPVLAGAIVVVMLSSIPLGGAAVGTVDRLGLSDKPPAAFFFHQVAYAVPVTGRYIEPFLPFVGVHREEGRALGVQLAAVREG